MRIEAKIGGAMRAALGHGFAAEAAQTAPAGYPVHPIRMIVPQAPGGSNDIWARYLGAKLSERLGQQIGVDNRARTMIGTEVVARSNPDGYTLLMTSAAFTMNPSNPAVSQLPYDPIKDFDWVGLLATGPALVTVGATVPAKTLPRPTTGGLNFLFASRSSASRPNRIR